MLQALGLRKDYPLASGEAITVLTLEHFEMTAREKAALIGPSGSGKSTLLNVISGMIRPTSGSVQLHGTDITQLSEARMDAFRAQHIGYVFQSFHLVPGFSAVENVILAMQFSNVIPHRERKRRGEELLDMVGLSHRLRHRPEQLSSGEQQRVSIARALANRPSLVLADEPTASLDYHNAQLVLQLLSGVCQESGAALLLCTHDLAIAESMDRMIALKHKPEASVGSVAASEPRLVI
jgi:ABC-type antimicrobial peptide transport system, ATPase component